MSNTESMTALELIRHRRSVRTFDGRAILFEDVSKVMACAEKADNPYHIPISWYVISAKENKASSPVIVGTDTFMAGKMEPIPHAEEAFGYSFEKILLYAESLGLGSTWIAGTMDRAAFEKAIGLKEGEVMPCISPLGYPAEKMSLREGLMRRGVKADSRFPFETLFFDGSFEKPLTREAAGDLGDLFEMVRLAPSAVNKQPWRLVKEGGSVHFYEKRSKGYVSESGWDLQKIDLGIAMYHWAMGLEEKKLAADFAIRDPGIPMPEGVEYIASYTCR